ncbi:MAG: hypothetical protein A2928_01960 [Candidatus Taylorbacteria bacterium RIFCSPLOWO2_01_FULL_45_15b]|uniref:Polyprenyl synthetase n=1 Tax=Candidatus Taylorbacteria bacterium RIFCSPLOWO2_01_FULL_45_15b TaxID=1802319 RepID=A0A1G2NE30_9BACT|nr:MAG: hypothetical protein A2928_01960 [Candidatus Taylorbacteria bacterium RIFCSPLOWO2_01_FULL_45_15b]
MDKKFDADFINKKVQKEIIFFLKDESELKADVEYVFKIAMPDRPKAYLMLQFAKALKVKEEKIMPFVMVADLMMAAAMNNDDIIDDNAERCGEKVLWKVKGINLTIIVTDYMYALIFSILKKYRPNIGHADFPAYQKSENLLLDYFRIMNIAQYNTTVSSRSLAKFTLKDLENLATKKASLLFQFCTVVPAYFANQYVEDLENFGYQLGIARQYISDIQDFMKVPGDNYKDGMRMEDYFTHQPNLVLILIGTSEKLSVEEKKWFYKNWTNSVSEKDRGSITTKVVQFVRKTDAILEAKKVLKKIQKKLKKSLSNLPNEEFKKNMSKWAFRSFPID